MPLVILLYTEKNGILSGKMSTRMGALIHSLEKKIPFKGKPFPSWKGAVLNKQEVLLHSRFSIVYENIKGLKKLHYRKNF